VNPSLAEQLNVSYLKSDKSLSFKTEPNVTLKNGISPFSINTFEEEEEEEEFPKFPFTDSSKRIKLKVLYGFAYLNPANIVCINTDEIYLVTGDTIRHKENLKAIEQKLKIFKNHPFFRLNQDIINCYFLTQVRRSEEIGKYQNYIYLQGMNRINISKEKAKKLNEFMEKSSF